MIIIKIIILYFIQITHILMLALLYHGSSCRLFESQRKLQKLNHNLEDKLLNIVSFAE